jgi:hypothetical protein
MINIDGNKITMKGSTLDLVNEFGLFYEFLQEEHPELLDKMIDFVEFLDKNDATIRITKDFKKE